MLRLRRHRIDSHRRLLQQTQKPSLRQDGGRMDRLTSASMLGYPLQITEGILSLTLAIHAGGRVRSVRRFSTARGILTVSGAFRDASEIMLDEEGSQPTFAGFLVVWGDFRSR